MSNLPPLTRNDIALALFGVQHMQAWWMEQPRSGFKSEQLRRCKALNKKLSGILDAMDPPQLCEDEINYLGDGDEPVYAPTDEARRIQSEAARQSSELLTAAPQRRTGDG